MVIDLGREVSRRPTRRRHRRPTPALPIGIAVALLLLLTGPIGPRAALAASWQTNAVHDLFWLVDDAAYTIDASAGGVALVRRDVDTGAVRWRRALDGTLATLYQRGGSILVSQFPPTPRLPTATKVVDSATGAPIGSYPTAAMPLVYVAGDVALVIDRVGAAPPAAPPDSTPFAYPPDYFDGDLEGHLVTAIDLATGSTRWSRPLESGASWALPGVHAWTEGFAGSQATWIAIRHRDNTIATWDVATGATMRRTAIGPLDPWSYVVALRDTVVVATQGWPNTVLSGFDPADLSPRWTVAVPGVPEATAWPVSCGGALCLAWPYGVWGFDPHTGRALWHHEVVDVFDDDQPLLAVATVDGPAQVNVGTGELRPVPGGWRIVQARPHGRTVVVARTDDRGRTMLGLLDQVSGTLTSLGGVGSGSVGRCQATGSRVACADDSWLRVWHIDGGGLTA